MHLKSSGRFALIAAFCAVPLSGRSAGFEGYIHASTTQNGASLPLLYVVGSNCMRIEVASSNSPNPVNIVDKSSHTMTLVYPDRRAFLRFPIGASQRSEMPPGFPAGVGEPPPPPPPPPPPQHVENPMAGVSPGTMPPGGLPPGIGPTNFSGMPGGAQMPPRPQMPPMPQMPAMQGGGMMGGMPPGGAMRGAARLELQATGQTTNLLGYTCQGYEIKRHGQRMEIWATDQLWPFQAYLKFQPHAFGPPMMEERWSEMLAAKNLFPLSARMKLDNGVECFSFDVESIKPGTLTRKDAEKFQVPAEYAQIMARPF